MTDRSEKIITLAREMLRSDMMTKQQPVRQENKKLSLSIVCLTTVLSAAAGSMMTGWIVELHRPINRYERTELDALIFYAAHEKNLDESSLRHEVAAHLNIVNLEDMNLADFRAARLYLQDRAR
ncbi:MAG: hypothetical protein JO126_03135 [Alphaproteobacteria bacterium]|nr:hypothetical protein [Alphaproteobacteria bacterium]